MSFFLLLFLLLLPPATCIMESSRTNVAPGFNYYDSANQPFGFLIGGQFNIEISDFFLVTKESPLFVMYCHPAETSVLGDNYHPSCTPGETNSTDDYCAFGAVVTQNRNVVLSGTVELEEYYTLWFYSCGQNGQVTVSFAATNPGGNQLSSSQIRFPETLVSFFCLWNVMLLVWTWNWVRFRKHNILLHNLLSGVFFVKVIALVVGFLHWYFQSREGTLLVGPLAVDILFNFFFALILFYACCLIAKGWCITRIIVSPHEKRLSVAFSLVTACGYLFFLVFQSYLLVVVIVFYILFVRYIYLNAGGVIANLETQALSLAATEDHVLHTAGLFRKVDALRIFQRVLSIYIFVILLTLIGLRFFFSNRGWIEEILLQSYDVLFCAFLGYSFRLRDFSLYFVIATRLREAQERRPAQEKSTHFFGLLLPGTTRSGGQILKLAVLENQPEIEGSQSSSSSPASSGSSSSEEETDHES